jgi:hypothetical protein
MTLIIGISCIRKLCILCGNCYLTLKIAIIVYSQCDNNLIYVLMIAYLYKCFIMPNLWWLDIIWWYNCLSCYSIWLLNVSIPYAYTFFWLYLSNPLFYVSYWFGSRFSDYVYVQVVGEAPLRLGHGNECLYMCIHKSLLFLFNC